MHKQLSKTELLRQEWMAALRSGNYRQCDRTYHNEWNDTYCVVGVLIDLCAKRDIDLIAAVVNNSPPINTISIFDLHNQSSSVGEKAMEQVGLPGHYCRDLYYRNDKMKMSFPDLAQYLEWLFKLNDYEEEKYKERLKEADQTERPSLKAIHEASGERAITERLLEAA